MRPFTVYSPASHNQDLSQPPAVNSPRLHSLSRREVLAAVAGSSDGAISAAAYFTEFLRFIDPGVAQCHGDSRKKGVFPEAVSTPRASAPQLIPSTGTHKHPVPFRGFEAAFGQSFSRGDVGGCSQYGFG
jgi:hypothetical protein